MSHSFYPSSRRDAIGKMLLAVAGTGMLPFAALAKEPTLPLNRAEVEKLQPFEVQPSSPLQPGPGGLDIRTLIHSSQTNKQFSCVEFAVAAKKMGPAPHYHKELDELMYVLEGTATVMVEDTVYEIPAGGWHFRPRNMVHTFFNRTDKTFRGIDMYFNQNFEDFLEEMFHKIIPDMQRQHLTPADPAIAKRMHDLHEKFGMVGFPEKRQPIIDKYGLIA
jgi:quercetin dioxygenase-like cupin family protein